MDRLLELFADVLEYPGNGTIEAARECEAAARAAMIPAGELNEFARFAEQIPAGSLEEIYTAAFDLGAATSLYVGHHLFGEGYPRSMFMAELAGRYRGLSFSAGSELPDHLCVILRFLARSRDEEEKQELIRDAVLPALESIMAGGGSKNGSAGRDAARPPAEGAACGPYTSVLLALKRALTGG